VRKIYEYKTLRSGGSRLLTTVSNAKLSHGLAEGEEGESEDIKG
jgi:hypothetical protein